jgi:hypothetical protein
MSLPIDRLARALVDGVDDAEPPPRTTCLYGLDTISGELARAIKCGDAPDVARIMRGDAPDDGARVLRGDDVGRRTRRRRRYVRVDPSDDNQLAVRTAARLGNVAVVSALLADARTDPSAFRNDALRGAAQNGHVRVVQRLMADVRTDPSDFDNFALRRAAMFGYVRVVDALLTDARVATMSGLSFYMACVHGHASVVRRLMADARLDPSVDDNACIVAAAVDGNASVVALLMRDPRTDPSSAIHGACMSGSADVVALLLRDARVNPTGRGRRSWSCVRMAARFAQERVVELLLRDARVQHAGRDAETTADVLRMTTTMAPRSGVSRRALVSALAVMTPTGPSTRARRRAESAVTRRRDTLARALDALVRTSLVCRDVVVAYVCRYATGVSAAQLARAGGDTSTSSRSRSSAEARGEVVGRLTFLR